MKNTYIKEKSSVVCVHHNGIAEEFLKSLEKRKYSAKTIKSYHVQIKHFYLFLDAENITALQDVTTEILEKYQKHLLESSFSPWSVKSYLRTLRILFDYLENEGVIFDNPTCRLIPPKLDKPLPDVPSEEDIKKILGAVDVSTPTGIRTRAMIETAYSCALRVEELTGMDMSSIDFRQSIIRVTGKGRKERALPAGRQSVFWTKQYLLSARETLLNGKIDEAALWISREGTRMSVQAFQKIMQYLSEKSGLEKRVTPHGIRRACATHMLNNGAHPMAIQHLLGHRTLRTLSHYLRMTIHDLMETHGKTRLGK